MKHFNVILKPDGKQISIHEGATLLDAAGQAGIILNTACGGVGTCNKCVAYLDPDGRRVLACQCRVRSDLTVTIPAESRFFEQRILAEGIDTRHKIQPDIFKGYPQKGKVLGLAIDLGTTTVVAKLIDMKTGQCLSTEAALNPQTRLGDDVVSRIAYAETDENAAELHRAIIACVTDLMEKLCQRAAVSADHIYEVCLVGNTTMSHIFLELPVSQLGRAPYEAFSLDAHDLPAGESSLPINPAGNIHTVENIAGFVGSDTTAVALAADMDCAEEMTLIVDVGTNGELVFGTKDRLYAASCAAGPAFEGARITCGSRAVNGAIEAVVTNDDDIDLDVIGNAAPRSICGSGLIDAVAVLLDLGIIDRTGRFVEPAELKEKLPPAIFARLTEHQGQPAFFLSSAAKATGRPVLLTQRDIREAQLAKAAIRAGIKLLQKKIGLDDCDMEQVLLAGAFGNYIRPASALRIGLLPEVAAERIHFVGNAASSGAQMILVSRDSRALARKLARKIEYVEIAHQPDFQDVFADSLLF
ncbi:MAG: ASKHA domain-containing protein [Planctomycetota bacterium]|jgi:uncharacterized 2Fe-2S/4Fe-4S cluster protein (DUF4445 family)